MFEEQCNELWLATDLVAERSAPATYREFTALSSIAEPQGAPGAEASVAELLDGDEAVVHTAREVFALAEPAADQLTMNLLLSAYRCARRPHGCCGASPSRPASGVVAIGHRDESVARNADIASEPVRIIRRFAS